MTPTTAPVVEIKLGKFEGQPVNAVGLEIRNSAGGLNESMKTDPVELHIGDEVTVTMRCKVTKIRHDPLKDADGLRRVHILDASDATIIDDELVATAIDAQKKRIEERNGVKRLPIELIAEHEAGDHTELTPECPMCDQEKTLAAEEAGSKKK